MTEELKAYILTEIDELTFKKFGKKTTIAFLMLKNGFEIVGTSAVADPDNYDLEIGKHWAYQDALVKLQEYLAFYNHNDSKRNI